MAQQQGPEPAEREDAKRKPMPAEGPHARPDLTDQEKTPGTGSLPKSGGKEADVGPD